MVCVRVYIRRRRDCERMKRAPAQDKVDAYVLIIYLLIHRSIDNGSDRERQRGKERKEGRD